MRRWAFLPLLIASASACGGGSTLPTGPSPVSAPVAFRFELAESTASSILSCAVEVSLHPSWWGFAEVRMEETGTGGFAVRFEKVPVGRHTVRISQPSGCGAPRLAANGTPLGARGGAEAEFGFTVHSDGSVTP